MLQDHSIAQETGMNEYWPGLLDEHDVQFLVLDRHSDSDLLNLFRSQPGWAVDFEDEEAVIFVRADIARMHNSRARTHDDAWVAAWKVLVSLRICDVRGKKAASGAEHARNDSRGR